MTTVIITTTMLQDIVAAIIVTAVITAIIIVVVVSIFSTPLSHYRMGSVSSALRLRRAFVLSVTLILTPTTEHLLSAFHGW